MNEIMIGLMKNKGLKDIPIMSKIALAVFLEEQIKEVLMNEHGTEDHTRHYLDTCDKRRAAYLEQVKTVDQTSGPAKIEAMHKADRLREKYLQATEKLHLHIKAVYDRRREDLDQ